MFWISAERSPDNIKMFLLLLSSASEKIGNAWQDGKRHNQGR